MVNSGIDTAISIGLYLCYAMLFVGLICAVVFPILQIFSNPKSAKTSLVGIGAFGAVFLISYLLADGTVLPSFEKYGITPAVSKGVGAGLVATYLLGAIMVVSLIVGEIRKFIS